LTTPYTDDFQRVVAVAGQSIAATPTAATMLFVSAVVTGLVRIARAGMTEALPRW
jgi:hypothetical protein